jgi:hypothetical protein
LQGLWDIGKYRTHPLETLGPQAPTDSGLGFEFLKDARNRLIFSESQVLGEFLNMSKRLEPGFPI